MSAAVSTVMGTRAPGRKPPRHSVVQSRFAESSPVRAHSKAVARTGGVGAGISGGRALAPGPDCQAALADREQKSGAARGGGAAEVWTRPLAQVVGTDWTVFTI